MSSTVHPALALGRRLPNAWDLAALVCVFAVIAGVAHVAPATIKPLDAPEALAISLDPSNLPNYALRTTLRMFAALACSLLFTLSYATWAAKSRRARLVLIPILDVLQSVPILGFLSFTTVFFMSLFPGKVAGLELAAIFAIFTSQAWNMAFSFYQSLTTLPDDLEEASRSFQLTSWQRFWRLEVPFAMPGLVWNTMLSMSGGWFFVVASEAITLGDKTWTLPGIGSYVAAALDKRDMVAIWWAIVAMLVVIIIYDQLLFRPLVAWSSKFRFEVVAGAEAEDPWVLKLLLRTHVFRQGGNALAAALDNIARLRIGRHPGQLSVATTKQRRLGDAVFLLAVLVVVGFAVWKVVDYVAANNVGLADVGEAFELGFFTLIRVAVLIALAAVIWVPLGVWIGLRPAWARRIQVAAQFLAAFPANLLFPIFVIVIIRYHLTPDIWLTPLMILGTQWYILFNVVAGASAFPGDLLEAAANFRVGGWRWWRRVILPGIFPYFVTGAITASGGSWNASIVAEVATWGDDKLSAHGLGAYIAHATDAGDFPRIILGVAMMSLYVLFFNRAVWRPMYAYATRRTKLG
jgi:NitT/TauT family transport system permease protein